MSLETCASNCIKNGGIVDRSGDNVENKNFTYFAAWGGKYCGCADGDRRKGFKSSDV